MAGVTKAQAPGFVKTRVILALILIYCGVKLCAIMAFIMFDALLIKYIFHSLLSFYYTIIAQFFPGMIFATV